MARTDNDTWDLATSVGSTATGVAVGRALASRGPNPLINDPFAEPLVRAVGVNFFTRVATGELDPADVEDDDTMFGLTRMRDMMGVRTRYFDDFFLHATGGGVRQAVILASGLDARAYRLAWPAGTIVYEIDQPRVIEFKTSTGKPPHEATRSTPSAPRSRATCTTASSPEWGISSRRQRATKAPRANQRGESTVAGFGGTTRDDG